MAARVPGRVDHAHATPPPSSKTSPSRKRLRVGPLGVVEVLAHELRPAGGDVRVVVAEDREEAGERLEPGQVGLVHVPRHVGEQVIAGDVVLVAVAVQTRSTRGSCARRGIEPERGIDHERLLAPAHEQRVALRILPALGAEAAPWSRRARDRRAMERPTGYLLAVRRGRSTAWRVVTGS